MSATVLLKDIIDALEMQFDESSSFLDLDTGRVETVSNDLLGETDAYVGEEPDLPAWQTQEWEIAKRIVSTDRFRQLPTKFDVHEWAIMQDFFEFAAIRQSSAGAAERYSRRRCIPAFQGYPSPAPDRVGLVSIPRRGAKADRAQLVRRASHQLAVGEYTNMAQTGA